MGGLIQKATRRDRKRSYDRLHRLVARIAARGQLDPGQTVNSTPLTPTQAASRPSWTASLRVA